MAKYRKKPVVVDAIRWDGSDQSQREIVIWANGRRVIRGFDTDYYLSIASLKGQMRAAPGDWIIRGEGEFYACKPDIFEATYEPVEGWE